MKFSRSLFLLVILPGLALTGIAIKISQSPRLQAKAATTAKACCQVPVCPPVCPVKVTLPDPYTLTFNK